MVEDARLPFVREPPVASLLQHLRDKPSRTWSIVVTVFGDCVLPRGGSLGAKPLLDIFAGMGIGGGVVRTALSRLSTDGWLQATRSGRHSFYRLTEKGTTTFAGAADRIYGPPLGPWDGRLHLLLPGGGVRDTARDALLTAGFGVVTPGVWIAPASTPVPPGLDMLYIEAKAGPNAGREMAERAWPLSATADAYRRFLDAFAPLHDWVRDHNIRPDLDALVARILLVHEYRRLVLRDPFLPAALLPANWPGAAARQLCRDVYPALLPGSERWLNEHARDEAGTLPSTARDLHLRFQAN